MKKEMKWIGNGGQKLKLKMEGVGLKASLNKQKLVDKLDS